MATRKHLNSPLTRVRGFTLIETLVVLIIGMIVLAGIATALQRYGDGVANQAAAQHANTVKKGAQAYIADNYASLVASSGPTTPSTVTPAMLSSGGYLPAGFNPINGLGQTFSVKVIEPTAGDLEAIILTSGGDTINGQNMRRIAQLIGVDGGYVATTGGSAVAEGAFGGWSRSLTPFGGSLGAGKLAVALFITDAATQDDFLHRSATPGKPERNRMDTAVDMAGNDINGAGRVNAGTVNAGKVNLPAGNTLQIGNSFYYGDNVNSAVRQDGGFYIQTPSGGSAPISQVGNIYSQGSIYAAGDVSANNNVFANESYANGWFRTQGNGGWYSSAYGGGWHMTDPTWIRAYNDKNIYTGGQMQAGTMRSNGRMSTGEFLHVEGVATQGNGCSPNGLVGRDPTGLLLSCQSGFWGKQWATVTQVVSAPNISCATGTYNGDPSIATCPVGFNMTGGGSAITFWDPIYGSQSNAPDASYPYGNGWAVVAGAKTANSCFRSFAVCLR